MSDFSNLAIIILLAALVVGVIGVLIMQHKNAKHPTSDSDSLLGSNVDEQLKTQFKSVLLGQSIILAKCDYDAFLEQKVKLQQQADLNNDLKLQNQQLNNDYHQAQQHSKELEIQLAQKISAAEHYQQNTEQQLTSLLQEKTTLQQKTETLQQTINEQNAKLAQLESQKQSLEQLRTADQERFDLAQQDLEHRLNTMSEKFLQERSESLNKINNEKMGQIIDPLRQELTTFRELIVTTQKNNSEYAGQLQTELKHLQSAQSTLSTQADQLTQALLKGNKSQGMWGEQQLERVLELAGLEKNLQYLREQDGININNQKIRADVVIPLPRQHSIIVDAKCSLTAYTDLVNAELTGDHDAYKDALKRHIDSVTKHVDELAQKDYQTAVGFNSPDFVFMFVPIDQALAVALKEKPSLYEYAQKKNIALISPSIAIPALRIVGELWIFELQGRKLKDLAMMADRIYLKSCKVCEIFGKLLKDSDALNKDIAQLNTSLYQGRGNLRQLLENFKQEAPALTAKALEEIKQDLDADADAATLAPNNNEPLNTPKESLPELSDVSTLISPPAVKRRVSKKKDDRAIEATVESVPESSTASAPASAQQSHAPIASTASTVPTTPIEDTTPDQLAADELAIIESAEQQRAQSRATMDIPVTDSTPKSTPEKERA